AFLRNAEVIQRVGVSVVGIERQTAIGPRSQGQEAGLVVRIGEASAPVDRTYLRISQRHRPGHEVRFQKEPQRTGTVRRPEGIAILGVKLGSSSRAGSERRLRLDRKSTRLNSSHGSISYAVFCLKKKTSER